MSAILGLDAGGTKTLAALSDRNGTILATWNGPGLDPMAGDAWIDRLREAAIALDRVKAPEAVVLGLPCHGEIDTVSALQIEAAAGIFSVPHLVLNDVEVACDGAFAGDDGVLILAGTGSMAWAKTAAGSLRIGGWGEAFGDEGSAYWIGREALSLTAQALDGRLEAKAFADAILDACGVCPQSLIDWAFGRQNRRTDYAALAVRVSQLSEHGDPVAERLLTVAAGHLAAHAEAARRRLGQADLAWSHAGGVFRSPRVLNTLTSALGAPAEPRLPPVGGALWRAATLAGWHPGPDFIAGLSSSLAALT
jgi:N-acetylglucosamine kinase